MATCDTEALMEAGKCLEGLEGRDLEVLKAQLLCEIYSTASEEPPILWDDLRVSALSTKLGGSKDPDWVQFMTNGAASRGVYNYAFSHLTEEEVHFSVQLPHSWTEGTDLRFHVHWAQPDIGDIGLVIWGLEYTWANIDQTFPNTSIVGVSSFVDGTLKKHRMTESVVIPGTGKTSSSMIMCRLFRDLTNQTGKGANSYLSDAFLLEADFHYQVSSLGEEF